MPPIRLPNPPISEIEPGLYLGDLGSSYRRDILAENKITAMVSLSDGRSAMWSSPANRALVPKDRHFFLPCLDTSTQDLVKDFAEIYDFMDDKLQDPGETGNVLVHCTMGVSRSTTIVVAYLMRKQGLSRDDALAVVKKSRKVKPNPNFMEQLEVWAETNYEIWADPDMKTPKKPYADFLDRRAERLKEKGLTGNEPITPDL